MTTTTKKQLTFDMRLNDQRAEELTQQLTFDMRLNDQRAEELTQQLMNFNQTHFTQWEQNQLARNPAPLHLFALNQQGEMVGGLTGRTNAIPAWFEISVIWVHEGWRGQGIGQQLMQQAEAEACRRGCRYARLATSHYQAPDFYAKLGYSVYGRLENCPPGETCFYYQKCIATNRNDNQSTI